MLSELISAANSFLWGIPMLVVIIGSGVCFTIALRAFQFAHFADMWKRIVDSGGSDSGVSSFASFCTTMAMRVGTGNVAGVAVAIYSGGPGALFWMIVAGMTNSAVCFAETTLGSLYKTQVDGEYRGGGYYCAERGLGWNAYGMFLAALSLVGIGAFMPAAATYTICEAFNAATGVPMVLVAVVVAAIMLLTVLGGIKRIAAVATAIVPIMCAIYILVTIGVIVLNAERIPEVISMILVNAFSKEALIGGGIGLAIQQGFKRGTFSSASGMGESTPTAAASETSHPVKVGLANAAGVWLDTVVICTCSGLLILMTDCFNTEFGYIGTGAPELASMVGEGGGVVFVQYAARTVMGQVSELFIAVMLFLFSFTCLISYYYEAETASTYLFRKREQESIRKIVTKILQFGMPICIFFFGIIEANLAWDLSDLALGSITFVNMLVVISLFPKCIALYKDYRSQIKAGKDPYYNPDKLCWPGVDVALWKRINGQRIKEDTPTTD